MKKLNKLGVVLLASGLLLTACAKSGNSSHSSSTSSKLTASEQKQLKQATSDYKTFVWLTNVQNQLPKASVSLM